jgi:ABC-type molybdate transport system permease subunit
MSDANHEISKRKPRIIIGFVDVNLFGPGGIIGQLVQQFRYIYVFFEEILLVILM